MPKSHLPPLIRSLCDPKLYGQQEGGVRVVETHISWVLLTGKYAYKIKKPVDFGFLDFSTLELRHHYCEEELRLNKRLTPGLYLGVAAITGDEAHPTIDGDGPVLEYAVKLEQFDEACLADRLLERLAPEHFDDLALRLARFHGEAAHSTASDHHGLPEKILSTARHNFEHLLRLNHLLPGVTERLKALQAWTGNEFELLERVFLERKQAGFVRECHGDLHCGNLVLIGDRLVPFDCIEFSEDFRWIDCQSEIAFLMMDLEVRGRPNLAWRLLNRYLETTGDYAGLSVLNFYRVYRALVRAKIAALSLEQYSARPISAQRIGENPESKPLPLSGGGKGGGNKAEEWTKLEEQCLAYLDYAEQALRQQAPLLLITHGFSGSGKSYLARELAARLPAVRIASDIERKRLAGFAAEARTGSTPAGGIYTEAMTRQTYDLLLNHAETLLKAGFNAILDATYLKSQHRHNCQKLAERMGALYFILDCSAPEAVLRERISRRMAEGADPSEADLEILGRQLASAEPLQPDELAFVVGVDTSRETRIDGIMLAVGSRPGGKFS